MKKIIKILSIITAIIVATKVNAQCIANAGNDQTINCPGGAVTLSASISATLCNCTNYSYQWTPTVGLSSPNNATTTASPNTTTVYKVCITAYKNHGCITTCCVACDSVVVNVNNSGCRLMNVNSSSKQLADIKAYPNPAKNFINVDVNENLKDAEISIYDVNGRVVWQKTKISDKVKLTVDVSAFSKGVYFLKAVENNKEIYKDKILIE